MRAVFAKPKRNTDVRFQFDYEGTPIDVKARVRADGTLVAGADYFADGHLVFGTTRQIGTLADAVEEFLAFQESQTPDQVYDNDPDRLGVGEEGQVSNSARDQVRRMNAKDRDVSSGRMGFRYQPPDGQEYDY